MFCRTMLLHFPATLFFTLPGSYAAALEQLFQRQLGTDSIFERFFINSPGCYNIKRTHTHSFVYSYFVLFFTAFLSSQKNFTDFAVNIFSLKTAII